MLLEKENFASKEDSNDSNELSLIEKESEYRRGFTLWLARVFFNQSSSNIGAPSLTSSASKYLDLTTSIE